MEKLFMSAGIVTAIVLCVIGIVKLPFNRFKEKHPQWFKAVFTILSIVLAGGLCVVNQLYILCDGLLTVNFAILVSAVFAGVFGGYGGVYEGLGLKELVKKIVDNIKKARDIAQNEKVVKYLNKIEDIDKAIAILEERKNNTNSEV